MIIAPLNKPGNVNTAYTTVEPSAQVPGASDIVRYATATGARSVAVSARQLIPSGAAEALDFYDYAWSPDGTRLLLFTNAQRVWRENTRGDYWVLELATGRLHPVGGSEAKASSLMYAKFSPSGDRVAYVREGDLFVERVAQMEILIMTSIKISWVGFPRILLSN